MSTDRDDALDGLIDETARELTLGSPSPALRENVRARRSGRSGYRRIPIWQPALGTAALAVLAIALMLPDRESALPAVQENQAIRPEMEPPSTVAGVLQPSGMAEQPRTLRPSVVREPPTRASNQVAVPPNPLPPIEPLEIEPVPIERAVIEEIAAPMPLSIDRLHIERLSLE
jgi:hypothetical protein